MSKKALDLLKIIGTSTIVAILILWLSKNDHYSCPAIDAFSSESSFGLMLKAFKLLAIGLGIWLIGLLGFFVIRNITIQLNIYIFFAVITTLSLSPILSIAINRTPETNRQLKITICSKSEDDGMWLNFKKLTKEEYDFVNSETHWLPKIPENSNNININYYRDDFLGDFHLSIDLELSSSEIMDSLSYPKWIKSKGKYYYEDYQN